jgi:hypothetical protein
MLQDEGYLEREGESIFFMVRDLYAEWNRLMSIQQTKALEVVRPPYVHEVRNPGGEPQGYPHEIGTNLEVGEGEIPQLLQTQDMSGMFRGAAGEVSMALHKGSANITDLADISGMRNASWVAEQMLIRDRILFPRVQALETFYARLAHMIISEYRLADFPSPLPMGKGGRRRAFTARDLGDPDEYTISYRFVPDNRRQRLANYSLGMALKGTLSEDTIIRDIFQADDPDGEIGKLRAEEARRTNPIIFYYDMAAGLLDQADRAIGEDRRRLLRKARIAANAMVDEIRRGPDGEREPVGSRRRRQRQFGIARGTPAPAATGAPVKTGLLALPSLLGDQAS